MTEPATPCPDILRELTAQPPLGQQRARRYKVGRARRGMGMPKQRKSLSRIAALSLVVAVPSVAASPASFGLTMDSADSTATPELAAMPFETPGESFPGSAFYYLADEDFSAPEFAPAALASSSGGGTVAGADSAALAAPSAIARSLVAAGSGTDRSRAQRCLTMAVYYEAASESLDGQRAVAQVVLNRVSHPSYPNTVCGVVFQGSERRTGCQFSFTCDGALARQPSRTGWSRAYGVAADALSGRVYAPIGLATHYHTLAVNPYWASSLQNVGTIGFHTFYTWRGAAGRKAAFNVRYRGLEPVAAPKPRSAAAEAAPAADPLTLARQYEAQNGASTPTATGTTAARPTTTSAARQPAPAPAPSYSAEVEARGGDALFLGDRLPQGGSVNPGLENSGQWLRKP